MYKPADSQSRLAIPTPFGLNLLVVLDDGGIVAAEFVPPSRHRRFTRTSDPLLREARAQVQAYFRKRLIRFDLPLSLSGTPLELDVWRLVSSLSVGQIVSYGEVAGAIGRPSSHRGVAAAMSKTPIDLFVPAHRVIGSDGRIHGAVRGSLRHRLLQFEGYTIRRSGAVERAQSPRAHA